MVQVIQNIPYLIFRVWRINCNGKHRENVLYFSIQLIVHLHCGTISYNCSISCLIIWKFFFSIRIHIGSIYISVGKSNDSDRTNVILLAYYLDKLFVTEPVLVNEVKRQYTKGIIKDILNNNMLKYMS